VLALAGAGVAAYFLLFNGDKDKPKVEQTDEKLNVESFSTDVEEGNSGDVVETPGENDGDQGETDGDQGENDGNGPSIDEPKPEVDIQPATRPDVDHQVEKMRQQAEKQRQQAEKLRKQAQQQAERQRQQAEKQRQQQQQQQRQQQQQQQQQQHRDLNYERLRNGAGQRAF